MKVKFIATILILLLGLQAYGFNTLNNTSNYILVTGDRGSYSETVPPGPGSVSQGWDMNKTINLTVQWAVVCNDSTPPCPYVGTFYSNEYASCKLGIHKQQVVTGSCNGIQIVDNTVICAGGEQALKLVCPQ